jgi:hypothetical protein
VQYEGSGSSFVHRGLDCLPPRCWSEALFGDGTLEGRCQNAAQLAPCATNPMIKTGNLR